MKLTSAIAAHLALSVLARRAPPVAHNQGLNVDATTGLRGHINAVGLPTRIVQDAGLKCHESKIVGSKDDKWLKCPEECPVFADNRDDGIHCNFECVEATKEACSAVNPKETVPDLDRGICRACIVYGCDTCARDGTDTCGKCNQGYHLVNGKCENDRQMFWNCFFVFLGLVGLFMVGWIIDLARRPKTNADALKEALNARSRSKLRQPAQQGRELWPLTTNLLKQDVAGLGVLLQFNFSAAIIGWSLAVAIAWWLMAQAVDVDLLILGTRAAKTARQNCILVAWGYETQHRLMYTKYTFVGVLYIVSCVLCAALALRQMRVSEKIDQKQTTHKDFAARIEGLPLISGDTKVEEELKRLVSDATGHKVVGVSVCWDFQENEDDVMELIECDLYLTEKAMSSSANQQVDLPPEDSNSLYARIERSMLASDTEYTVPQKRQVKDASITGSTKEVDVDSLLKSLKTCPDAYVVFETEEKRNAAVEIATEKGGLEYRGNTLRISQSRVEPQSVNWRNCANTNLATKAGRVAMGFGFIFAGLALWVVAFYLPYAWFALTFDYTYGQEPGFFAGMTFSMVVVAGNQLMYFICSEVADRARFIYVDDREVCYMLLFCFACVFNVLLDLVTTYYVAYRINVGLGMKTYDGKLLAKLDRFTEIFESYAMQRRLGKNLWQYAFPSTFLIPFIIEPVVTIIVPYQITASIVARQPKIRGFMAERYLQGLVFDLSRYSDLLLDVMIASLIFFFPGGLTVQMFMAMALSHMFVYAMDQSRLLRSAQACQFANSAIDRWAQWILCVPLGFFASCFVFKFNCESSHYCVHGAELITSCAMAFFGHVVIHTFVLVFIIPKFAREVQGDDASSLYSSCSKNIAASWFSVNPIFCLRSEFVYAHNPPCKYCMPGKEHVLQANPAIGLYFADKAATAEDFDKPPVDVAALKESAAKAHESLKSTMSEMSQKLKRRSDDNPPEQGSA